MLNSCREARKAVSLQQQITTAMNNSQKLIDKINSYKSYNQQVKDRVLKQVDPNRELSEGRYKAALKLLPTVMRNNAEHVKKLNRVKKAAVKLERHAYAPELNALHFKGFAVKAAGAQDIDGAVEQIVSYNYDLVKDRV